MGGVVAFAALAWVLGFPWVAKKIAGDSRERPAEIREGLSPEAWALVERCTADLDRERMIDVHAHVVGFGSGGTGCYVNPAMQTPRNPFRWARYQVYLAAARVTDPDIGDRQYMDRLRSLCGPTGPGGRVMLLGFDEHWTLGGEVDRRHTEFYTPNEYVVALAEAEPELFRAAISVHPHRPDALGELERWAGRGARLVKWLPNAMGIDPADPRHDPYYAKMRELDLVLLCHSGEERAVESADAQELGNPLRLRRPLRHGVRVLVAHCASLGTSIDLDHADRPEIENFSLFLRLMGEADWDGLLYGEISAATLFNRVPKPLRTLLRRRDLHGRLVNGSDYPLPAIDLMIQTGGLVEAGLLEPEEARLLDEVFEFNPLLFDLCVKRCLRGPEGESFPPDIFHDRPELSLLGGP